MSKKVFLDLGANVGQGLEEFIGKFQIDGTWEVHSFEPNKESFDILKSKFSNTNFNFHNKGLASENCIKIFNAENIPGTQSNAGAGSTFIEKENWSIRSPANWGAGELVDSYEVECLDFCEFILTNFSKEDFIVVKMDIEGGEYEILPKLIKSPAAEFINEIFIEFHNWAIRNMELPSNETLQSELREIGIKTNGWK